jgi:hypothetical protein
LVIMAGRVIMAVSPTAHAMSGIHQQHDLSM